MNLSEKVEETFGKLKPHSEAPLEKPPEALSNTPVEITEEKSTFSLNLEDLKDYLLVILCFAIALAAAFLLIIPQYQDLPNVNANFTNTQTRLAELQSQSEYLKGLVGLKEELEANIVLADQALPSTEDRVPYTLDQIVQVAEFSGVTVEALSLVGITDPIEGATDTLKPVTIQLGIGGSEEQILEFFYNLENARTIIEVTNFQLGIQTITTLSSSEDGEESATTIEQQSATMVLKAYLKEDAETAVDLSVLANSPSYDKLFEKLKSMKYYEPAPLQIEVGRDNPFDVNEASGSIIPNEEEEPVVEENEEEDSSGITQ